MSNTLNVIITDAGIAEVVNAQHTGTAPVVLTQVGFGRGIYTPTASQTALHDEIKRVGTIAGGVVGDNIMHIQALDSGGDAYAVYEIGVYTASGTLFAVYSQPLPILHKVANSEIMCVIDFVLSGVEPTAVTVGDTNYALAPATTTNQGVVELATNEEAIAGIDTERAVTPAAGAAAYVSLSKDQAVLGNKAFEKITLGRMNLSKNIISDSDLGVIEKLKNDDNTDVISNNYFVNGNVGSYLIQVLNVSGSPSSNGARMVVAHTNTNASMSNYAYLQIANGSSDWDGFAIKYDNTLSANVATIAASSIVMDGSVQFTHGFTGIAPKPSLIQETVGVPIGGIVAVWFPSAMLGVAKVGGSFTASARTYYVACNNEGTMQRGSEYIPAGTYVNLMERSSQSGATWALMQRTA